MGRWIGRALLVCLFGLLGCTENGGLRSLASGTTADLAGYWIWKIGPTACPVPGGFLLDADGDQTFLVTQNGSDLSAAFIDSAGDSVTFAGTVNGNTIQGLFTITAPTPPGITCVGRAYVSNNDDDTVSVVDLGSGIEDVVVPVGNEPRGLDITPDGAHVFVANRFGNSVSVIRTSDDTVIATIPLSGSGEPYNLEVTPNGQRVYVVNKGTLSAPAQLAGNGSTSSVSVIDVGTLTETQVILPVVYSPEGIAIRPDGLFVAAVNRQTDNVDIISTASNAVVLTHTGGPSNARDAVYLPDGSKLYVVGEGGVVGFPGAVAAGSGYPLIPGTGGRDIVASPDGTRLYVARGPSNATVTVIDTSNDTVLGDIPLTTNAAYGIALCNRGRYAYVTDDSGSVAVVDLQLMMQLDTISVGSTPKFIKIRDIPPRRVELQIASIFSLNPEGKRQLDGTGSLVTDSSGQCPGDQTDYWVFIATPG